MSTLTNDPKERRVAPRKELALRVDVKVLPERDVNGILEGDGYEDLSISALSTSRPRAGMEGLSTLDVSATGMGIANKGKLKPGGVAALDLHLPGERTVIKLLGEVMWSVADRAGIRIAALDDSSAIRFREFLSH